MPEPTIVNTGGGLYAGGNVTAHHIVGRDQTTIGTPGAAVDLAQLLAVARHRIDSLSDHELATRDLDRDELRDSVGRIEHEAAKGDRADPKKIAHWLRVLGGLVPDVAAVVAAALANPVAGVAAAVQVAAKRVAASLDQRPR